MKYEMVELTYAGDYATITMNSPERRNALSMQHMLELTAAFNEAGDSKVRGYISQRMDLLLAQGMISEIWQVKTLFLCVK